MKGRSHLVVYLPALQQLPSEGLHLVVSIGHGDSNNRKEVSTEEEEMKQQQRMTIMRDLTRKNQINRKNGR